MGRVTQLVERDKKDRRMRESQGMAWGEIKTRNQTRA